jgi:hypothetical protein
MVQRVLGMNRLPDVATVSRLLASADTDGVASLRQLCRQLVLERLVQLNLRRITLDFGGSVIGTGRRAEGTAVGFNRNVIRPRTSPMTAPPPPWSSRFIPVPSTNRFLPSGYVV